MSKRKPSKLRQSSPNGRIERAKIHNYPQFQHPLHGTMYTINVSENMLVFIERMANDPAFRAKVQKLR